MGDESATMEVAVLSLGGVGSGIFLFFAVLNFTKSSICSACFKFKDFVDLLQSKFVTANATDFFAFGVIEVVMLTLLLLVVVVANASDDKQVEAFLMILVGSK